jgi:hypothetical protein
VMATLVQYLSAKVGIATGRSLPELCREHFPRPVSRFLWVQAELVCMATDLAEFVGAQLRCCDGQAVGRFVLPVEYPATPQCSSELRDLSGSPQQQSSGAAVRAWTTMATQAFR